MEPGCTLGSKRNIYRAHFLDSTTAGFPFWSQLETLAEREDDDIPVVHLERQHPSIVAQMQTLVRERPDRVQHHVFPMRGALGAH
jgi:hypothetical protein